MAINLCGPHHTDECWSVSDEGSARTRHAICTVLTTQMELRVRWASSLHRAQVAICAVYTTQIAFASFFGKRRSGCLCERARAICTCVSGCVSKQVTKVLHLSSKLQFWLSDLKHLPNSSLDELCVVHRAILRSGPRRAHAPSSQSCPNPRLA